MSMPITDREPVGSTRFPDRLPAPGPASASAPNLALVPPAAAGAAAAGAASGSAGVAGAASVVGVSALLGALGIGAGPLAHRRETAQAASTFIHTVLGGNSGGLPSRVLGFARSLLHSRDPAVKRAVEQLRSAFLDGLQHRNAKRMGEALGGLYAVSIGGLPHRSRIMDEVNHHVKAALDAKPPRGGRDCILDVNVAQPSDRERHITIRVTALRNGSIDPHAQAVIYGERRVVYDDPFLGKPQVLETTFQSEPANPGRYAAHWYHPSVPAFSYALQARPVCISADGVMPSRPPTARVEWIERPGDLRQ